MNQTIINVGLIGYGLSGRVFHAPILTSVPGFHLHTVYETRPENIALINKRYPEAKVVADTDEIFRNENIELVIVATPNHVHFSYAKKALESGKNVLVEKPFTCTSEEADELISIAKKTGKVLTVNHNRRWDGDFRTVEKVIKSNLLGEIVEYEAHFDKFRPEPGVSWKYQKASQASGTLYDLGSHLIDQAQCLFGLPEEVFGYIDVQRKNAEAVDSFEVILRYPDKKVTLKSGMMIREAAPHFSIHGRKGSFIKYGVDIQEEELNNGKIPKECKDWGLEPEVMYGKINTDIEGLHVTGIIESEAGDYRELYRNVYGVLTEGEELAVTAQQARNTIRIIELAEQSSEEKRWMRFE